MARALDAEREAKRLRGLQPELPPRAPEGEGLPRYGLRWDGPNQPVVVPMDDGYWTPFHLAAVELRASSASASRGWQMADELHLTVRDLTLRAEKAERERDAARLRAHRLFDALGTVHYSFKIGNQPSGHVLAQWLEFLEKAMKEEPNDPGASGQLARDAARKGES